MKLMFVWKNELPMQKRPEDDFSTDLVTFFFSSAVVASHNKQISFLN